MSSELVELKGSFFEYKKNEYEVLGTTRMKCISSGAWHVAVIYQPRRTDRLLEIGDFVREIADFVNKFQRID